jgi:PAS domain S-box-containing protein
MERPRSVLFEKCFWLLLFVWTVAVGLSGGWSLFRLEEDTRDKARTIAEVVHAKDLLFRHWNALHGGVYVELDWVNLPLWAHDTVRTRDGSLFGRIGSQQMLDQMHRLEDNRQLLAAIAELSAIDELPFSGDPDIDSVQNLTSGEARFTRLHGNEYFAYSPPDDLGHSCRECHTRTVPTFAGTADDSRVSVPMAPLRRAAAGYADSIAIGHFVLWGMGVLGLFAARRRLAHRLLERQKAVNAHKHREALFTASFMVAPDPMLLLRMPEGIIVDVNDQFTTILGYTHAEAIGKLTVDINIWVRDEDRLNVKQLLASSGKVSNYEASFVTKDGGTITAWVSAQTLLIDGAPHALVAARDVTEWVNVQRRVERLNECLLGFGSDYQNNILSLCRLALEITGATGCTYHRLEEKHVRPVAHAGDICHCQREQFKSGCLCHEVLKQSTSAQVLAEDLQNSSWAETDSCVRQKNLEAFIGQEVRHAGKKAGVMTLVFTDRYEPSDHDWQFLGIIASAVGVEEERYHSHQAKAISEARLRAASESSLSAFYLFDAVRDAAGEIVDFRFVHLNARGAELVSVDREGVIGQFVCEVLPFHRTMGIVDRYRRVVETGEPFEDEFAIDDPSVHARWLHYQVTKANDGVAVTVSDVTDRHRAEEELRKFKEMSDKAAYGVALAADDGTITYVNEHFAEAHGRTVSEMIGQDFRICHSQNHMDRVQELHDQFRTDGGFSAEEIRHVRKDGTEFPTLMSGTIIANHRDHSGFIAVTMLDITEIHERRQELKRLSAAVSQAGTMVCITDLHGFIEYVNPRFCEVSGYDENELLGQHISLMRSGRHDESVYREIWSTIERGQTWTGQLQSRRKSGELYWERKAISPVLDDDGKPACFVTVGDDITRDLVTQHKLAESDKLSAIGTLAAGVAHEFKNYLAGIIGNASFALDEISADSSLESSFTSEVLQQIVTLGEQANEVAMSLLTYSRAHPEERAPEDLRELIGRTIALVEKEMASANIHIVTYFEECPPVQVSASKIQQSLLNLLINARHAIGSEGVITITLIADNGWVRVSVGDTGRGIEREHLDLVFDPFFSTKGVWGEDAVVGTGMGLSICRNTAREHGGEMTVESIQGVGTTFTLTLPVASSERRNEGSTEESSTLSILLFALDRALVDTYQQQADANGHVLTVASAVRDVPSQLRPTYDLVIADSHYVGKIELFRLLQSSVTYQVPFVMVNCGDMDYQMAEAAEQALANYASVPQLSEITSRVLGQGVWRPTQQA